VAMQKECCQLPLLRSCSDCDNNSMLEVSRRGTSALLPIRIPPNDIEADANVIEEPSNKNICPPEKRLVNGISRTPYGR
jgi:hypothetical protein